MKVKVKDIKGKLISISPSDGKGFDIEMEYEHYNLEIYNVDEKDITVIME